MSSRRFFAVASALFSLLSTFGCTPEVHRYIRFPSLDNPGPAPYQRAAAIRHDPYPLNDVGPEIEGGRPREYQQPVNEVDRARMASTRPVALQPVPVPALPAAPPPVIMAPPASPPPVAGPPVVAPYPPGPASVPYPVQPRSPY
jgi:hypothetical protein